MQLDIELKHKVKRFLCNIQCREKWSHNHHPIEYWENSDR